MKYTWCIQSNQKEAQKHKNQQPHPTKSPQTLSMTYYKIATKQPNKPWSSEVLHGTIKQG